MSAATATITPLGEFDLAQSIGFGFGQRDAGTGEVMRLALVSDDYSRSAGVAVRQCPDRTVTIDVYGDADPAEVVTQTARILSLDLDSSGWDRLGQNDRLIGNLQRQRPGLRPPLFHSVYEALTWSVLSARRPHRQMAQLRNELSWNYGTVFEVDGTLMAAFPTPEQLLGVKEVIGLPPTKLRWLKGVAKAALEGSLSTEGLRRQSAPDVERYLQTLDGIGPFYSQLVTVRALGNTDLPPSNEPQLLSILGRLCGQDQPVTQEQWEHLALRWTGWRTWAAVAIRACGDELIRSKAAAAV